MGVFLGETSQYLVRMKREKELKKELEKMGLRMERMQAKVDKADEVRDALRAELKARLKFVNDSGESEVQLQLDRWLTCKVCHFRHFCFSLGGGNCSFSTLPFHN